ncbi:hypothetical protein JN531_012065 [Flagellatimonas centrodinii]|uniref:hypothetical protein n=1 Tax=Flagellatimonas centrodinii TaxID=2806210 RepID=UPI001FED7E25|nr:hypothetical protein [Flagellatimonas centrodinii]ULQ45835.1 hypothetical protein JN531_012065 [Flagellatimonas centrodinii]
MSNSAAVEPNLLPVKPGTLSPQDRETLREAGVIVIEHEHPEELRLLRASTELSASEMLECAAKALLHHGDHYNRGHDQRQMFAKLLCEAIVDNSIDQGAAMERQS